MTIGIWVTAFIIGIIGLIIGIVAMMTSYDGPKKGIIIIVITVLVVGIILGYGYWYCNYTADGARALKDQQSNLNNGLNREIIITAEDGREIFYYQGKCDIETNSGYILFEGEDGLRRIIYYGALDTIIIVELP